MLKKICIECEREYGSLDVDKCENCGGDVYLYLTEDKGFSKLKSSFSQNRKEEAELVQDLESLFKWEDFFNNLENEYSRKFLECAKDFKDSLDDYDFPETIIIENDVYKQYLRNFHRAVEVLLEIEEIVTKIRSYNLDSKIILKNLNDSSFDDEIKSSYIKGISQKIDEIAEFNNLDSYDGSLASHIEEINKIKDLFNEIELESDEINSLRPYFGDYRKYFAGFSSKPENYDDFREKVYSLKHLDVFSNEEIKNLKSIFKEIDAETGKVEDLNGQIPELFEDFDNLINGIIDDYTKHQFLDRYSDLKKNLFSFNHLKLLDGTSEIKRAQKFFNNFDEEWAVLAGKKAELDRKKRFEMSLKDFDDKWSDLNLQQDEKELFKQLNQFKHELDDIEGEYSDFLTEYQFDDYGRIFDYMAEMDDKIAAFDFANFKVSVLLNYLKDNSIAAVSKVERLGHYKKILNQLNSTDLEALEVFDSSLEIPYNDIEKMKNLFEDVNREISEVDSLKPIIDDYNDNSNLPDDISGLKDRLDSFGYLEIIPYFNSSSNDYVEAILYLKEGLKQVNIEINKASSLILECSKCKLEFEKVESGKMSKEDFIDKYSSLKTEISSFRYSDLWPFFDPNLKDFAELVREVGAILD